VTPVWDYTVEAHASLLAELIKAYDHTCLHIVAHSFGGAVALLLPPELLGRLATFVNIEGNLLPEDCGLASRRTASVTIEQFESSLLPIFKTDFPSGPGYFELDRAEPIAFFESARSLLVWSDSGKLLETFKALQCPRLYVYGERSDVSYALKELGDIPTLRAPSCGHFVTGDNPEWFFARFSDFLLANLSSPEIS